MSAASRLLQGIRSLLGISRRDNLVGLTDFGTGVKLIRTGGDFARNAPTYAPASGEEKMAEIAPSIFRHSPEPSMAHGANGCRQSIVNNAAAARAFMRTFPGGSAAGRSADVTGEANLHSPPSVRNTDGFIPEPAATSGLRHRRSTLCASRDGFGRSSFAIFLVAFLITIACPKNSAGASFTQNQKVLTKTTVSWTPFSITYGKSTTLCAAVTPVRLLQDEIICLTGFDGNGAKGRSVRDVEEVGGNDGNLHVGGVVNARRIVLDRECDRAAVAGFAKVCFGGGPA